MNDMITVAVTMPDGTSHGLRYQIPRTEDELDRICLGLKRCVIRLLRVKRSDPIKIVNPDGTAKRA